MMREIIEAKLCVGVNTAKLLETRVLSFYIYV